MGRPKKNTNRTLSDEHITITKLFVRQLANTCSDDETRDAVLASIQAYLQHIDKCLSIMADRDAEREERYKELEQKTIGKKGGKANDKSASRADDAREV